MKTVKRKGREPNENDGLPPDYEWVRFDVHTLLALPAQAARASREEILHRELALEDAKREELQRRKEELKQQALAEGQEKRAKAEGEALGQLPAKQGVPGPEPAPGWYRVLPRFDGLRDKGDSSQALRSADKDLNERQKSIREALVAKGPDRRLARPADWRESIAKLEANLPHFREPTRLLRNALALAEATQQPVRVPPMLLLGPPGVGKTHYTHQVAKLMGAPHASIAFDQPTAGSSLRGSDAFWSNSSTGLLFNMICMGDYANPVVLLDEVDKSSVGTSRFQIDPLAQLHGVLEPETARQTVDISVDIEFDASMVTYIATANSIRGMAMPILSRMEVFSIEPPSTSDAVGIARAVVSQIMERLNLVDKLHFDRKGLYVLAHLSPRLMLRTAEKAIAAAVAAGQTQVRESDLWAELGGEAEGPALH
jgi:DNA replication protein DnaC